MPYDMSQNYMIVLMFQLFHIFHVILQIMCFVAIYCVLLVKRNFRGVSPNDYQQQQQDARFRVQKMRKCAADFEKVRIFDRF